MDVKFIALLKLNVDLKNQEFLKHFSWPKMTLKYPLNLSGLVKIASFIYIKAAFQFRVSHICSKLCVYEMF